ncbi:unnamed protein product [Rotaria sordida]|uniref:SprT-like domain-containing protein n=1 Tax=Rotaria sordida TaxID=392033 RepID=A0A819RXU0_9BILA|nr:unnamed protein product [Rotaria sordida]CAF4049685.1 unnamed protein product [Rotaria sordida]CAF4144724.1 unnamed protein product [Rotaria sordida]CAF4253056.1 unnamed protein product [Rotaria sordida]
MILLKLDNSLSSRTGANISTTTISTTTITISYKISIIWSDRLTATAGHCITRRTTCTAVITLPHKVSHSPERCCDTLSHEMCHTTVVLIDGVMQHGQY